MRIVLKSADRSSVKALLYVYSVYSNVEENISIFLKRIGKFVGFDFFLEISHLMV